MTISTPFSVRYCFLKNKITIYFVGSEISSWVNLFASFGVFLKLFVEHNYPLIMRVEGRFPLSQNNPKILVRKQKESEISGNYFWKCRITLKGHPEFLGRWKFRKVQKFSVPLDHFPSQSFTCQVPPPFWLGNASDLGLPMVEHVTIWNWTVSFYQRKFRKLEPFFFFFFFFFFFC